MANRVDPDQTAPKEQFDQNLHCLLRHIGPNIENFYGSTSSIALYFVKTVVCHLVSTSGPSCSKHC